jgi:hypothetical protein
MEIPGGHLVREYLEHRGVPAATTYEHERLHAGIAHAGFAPIPAVTLVT